MSVIIPFVACGGMMQHELETIADAMVRNVPMLIGVIVFVACGFWLHGRLFNRRPPPLPPEGPKDKGTST